MSDERKDEDREQPIEDLDVDPEAAEDVKGGRDASTGLATGRRQYKPVEFTADPN
jgi:hypothetical protein